MSQDSGSDSDAPLIKRRTAKEPPVKEKPVEKTQAPKAEGSKQSKPVAVKKEAKHDESSGDACICSWDKCFARQFVLN